MYPPTFVVSSHNRLIGGLQGSDGTVSDLELQLRQGC
jgi:hypothetical protein